MIEGAIERGIAFLARFQSGSGSLDGDFEGPLFITPGYVFAYYATGTPIAPEVGVGLVGYLEAVQNKDGGFGLNIEGPSMLFTTVVNYVALRLLGARSPTALDWIRAHGGALGIPSWGKYWLAIMRLYDWEGVHPVSPEMWLLPRWLPAHPGRLWCQCRGVYLPLSYLYARRWQVPDDPLLQSIREEIFVGPPDWRRARHVVRPEEVYVPHSRAVRALNGLLAAIEARVPRRLRTRALAEVLDHVEHGETNTGFLAFGSVGSGLDAIVLHAAGSPLAKPSIDALATYLFDGERGLNMRSQRSSETWDTTLAMQALLAAGGADDLVDSGRRFILESQIRDDVPERRRYYRDPSRGGWAFSTRTQGLAVSDCTGEGLAASVALGGLPRERMIEAVDLLLWWQNRGGGWACYERLRTSVVLERLNASEMFDQAAVDCPLVEMTSSAMHGLVVARPALSGYRDADILRALKRGERFLRRCQRPDGSWEGSWGVCFTYGTWFGVRGLRAAGVGADPAIDRAVQFLLAKQLPDGGWGESWESSYRREYFHHPEGSQPVMTAWALLALLQAGVPGTEKATQRGVRFLLDLQLDDGDWPQHSAAGAFCRTSMLDYRLYRNIFPIWALALARDAPSVLAR